VASKNYASHVESGTKPHVIHGNPVLRFQVGGQTVVTRKVDHPGTPSLPFMGPAYLKAERALLREVEIAAEKAAKRFEDT
jgi:hypothetical protein